MIKKMGPLQGLVKMIPGVGSQLNDVDIDERQLARVEAIVLSMTPQDVNQLLRARKEMEKMMKQLNKGQIPAFGPR
jgi:signal recognition particle GTPase